MCYTPLRKDRFNPGSHSLILFECEIRDERYSRSVRDAPVCAIVISFRTSHPRQDDQSDFDWFKSYRDLARLLYVLVPEKQSRILMLGCGNSKLSEDVCFIHLAKVKQGVFNNEIDVGGRLQEYYQY